MEASSTRIATPFAEPTTWVNVVQSMRFGDDSTRSAAPSELERVNSNEPSGRSRGSERPGGSAGAGWSDTPPPPDRRRPCWVWMPGAARVRGRGARVLPARARPSRTTSHMVRHRIGNGFIARGFAGGPKEPQERPRGQHRHKGRNADSSHPSLCFPNGSLQTGVLTSL